jgi:hypothetical protein
VGIFNSKLLNNQRVRSRSKNETLVLENDVLIPIYSKNASFEYHFELQISPFSTISHKVVGKLQITPEMNTIRSDCIPTVHHSHEFSRCASSFYWRTRNVPYNALNLTSPKSSLLEAMYNQLRSFYVKSSRKIIQR